MLILISKIAQMNCFPLTDLGIQVKSRTNVFILQKTQSKIVCLFTLPVITILTAALYSQCHITHYPVISFYQTTEHKISLLVLSQ